MNTEVLTYSRSKGVFAGLTLEGAVVEQDNDSTRAIYGKHIGISGPSFRGRGPTPKSVEAFLKAVTEAWANRRASRKLRKTRNKRL